MIVFNVPRAGRHKEQYMIELIKRMYNDEKAFFKKGYGICDSSAEMIVYSFSSVRDSYYKINSLRVHYMELFAAHGQGKEEVVAIACKMGNMLFECGYQSFISIIDTGINYVISIVVNAVSFVNGHIFYDNNTCYSQIYSFLQKIVPRGCRLDVTENTFFAPDKRDGNYCHGVYV